MKLSGDDRENMSEESCECPFCRKPLRVVILTEDIPFFGPVLQSSFLCEHCGWHFTDVFPFEEKEAAEYRLSFGAEDMCVRVVKSSSCIMEIPELGILVEPGPASEGYITNIEGILMRMRDATKTAMKWENEGQKKNGRLVLKKLHDLRIGEGKATLILRDRQGFSTIICERAEKIPIF